MKILKGTAWAYGLLVLMTLGYFAWVLFAADMVNDIIRRDIGGVPGPTRLFATTEAAWVWSILAVVSLIGTMPGDAGVPDVPSCRNRIYCL